MKPRDTKNRIEEFISPLLVNIIDLNHPLCKLADMIDWKKISEPFDNIYVKGGRPGKTSRLMIGLHYLKYIYNLSDEEVVLRWLENPYYQYFTGETVFQTVFPIHPTSMTKWRQRVEKKGLSVLLEETIRIGFVSKTITPKDIETVNADTTVQEKAIEFPVDIKLYFKFMKRLVKFSDKAGIRKELRQTYMRKGKELLMSYNGYKRANQGNRASKVLRKMKTLMGRLYRDVLNKLTEEQRIRDEFKELSFLYENLKCRSKNSKDKIYSIHAPEVECISKGKSHKKYEFGNKVGIVSTSKKNFILSCESYHGNPYDGHTLESNLKDAEDNVSLCGRIKRCFVDLGYRGHNYIGGVKVNVVPRRLSHIPWKLRQWFKRRSSIEACISHMKRDNRMGKNYLKGVKGDMINAIFAACGHNLRLIMAYLLFFVYYLIEFFAMRMFNFTECKPEVEENYLLKLNFRVFQG